MIPTEKPPLYWEARRYCKEHQLTDIDDLERVRQGMAFAEYIRQMHPHIQIVVRLKSMLPPGKELNPELMQNLRQLQEQTARRLGLPSV